MYTEDYKIKRRLNTKRWRENNPEKVKEYSKLYEKRNSTKKYREEYSKKKGKINAKNWRYNNPDKSRSSSLKYAYGISIEDYNQMFVDQNGLCSICKERQEYGKNLCVDHNHKTNEIRGLLCRSCNSGLGHFKENIKNLSSAIRYLNDNTQ